MVPTSRRLLRESAPVAVVVGFWVVLSWLGRDPGVATGLRYAGVAMALLYVVVRGVRLADPDAGAAVPDGVGDLLRENARVALAAAPWFLAAVLVDLVDGVWREFVGIGLFTSPAGGLSFVLTATGVLTAVLYAVAVGLPRIRNGSVRGADADEAATAD